MDFKKYEKVKYEAIKLAQENKKVEPNILKTFWFPDQEEIRLIEVENDIPDSSGNDIEVFYFGQSEHVTLNSAIGLIRSNEIGKLQLPENWGSWGVAEELEVNK
jgi:hypothetical protein